MNLQQFMNEYGAVIIAALATAMWWGTFKSSLHMFQLNSYRADTHFKWLSKPSNLLKVCFSDFKNAKKPLVYTNRVKRMIVTAHILYIASGVAVSAFAAYLFGVVTGYPILLVTALAPWFPIAVNSLNAPFEKFNNNRYINDARRIIKDMPGLTTIGITGSYGKTSTKFFLHKLLSAKYETLPTPESYNTTLGVVKTVRNDLLPTHEMFVCEMGMKWKGDIAEICDIVQPEHAMITSIGPQHLESMKTLENIIEEKFSITDTITDGKIFLNFDNEYIRNHPKAKQGNVVSYGLTPGAEQADERSEAVPRKWDYSAENVTVSESGTAFTVRHNDETCDFSTALVGTHNICNIVGAIAVAHSLGVQMSELVLPVKRLEAIPHRLEVKGGGDMVIIDDSFNSNPAGAAAALDVLFSFAKQGRTRILITPGMVELGEKQEQLNRELGEKAAACCDYAVLIGEKQTAPIREGLLGAGFDAARVKTFPTFNEGMEFAKSLDGCKAVLIENDLPDNY